MSDYSPIYDVVRNKLKKSEDDLPNTDPDLTEETAIVVPLLLHRARCLKAVGYDGITGDKKTLFDGAAGRVVAARLRPSLLASENEGAGVIVETQIGDSRKRYAAYGSRTPGMVGEKTLEEQWVEQALQNLALLCPKKPLAGKGSFVGLPGRRRAEEARTGYSAVDVRDLLLPRGGCTL
jgi:hypothetical protein